MKMSESDKNFIARLEAMPLEQARRELASGTFGGIGSPNHTFASSWLAAKEAEFRDAREAETLSIAKEANSLAREVNSRTSMIDCFTRRAVLKDRIIAIAAIIIAAIAAREDIIWFISWLIGKIKTP